MIFSEVNDLAACDEILAGVINSTELPAQTSTGAVFHDLISCVVEQQIHYRSTKRIFQKMLQAAEIELLTLENFHVFEEKGLPLGRLSSSKMETLLRVITHWQTQNFDTQHWNLLSEEEVRAYLGEIKGIGPWTMDMLLLYTLERPDILPVDDYHLKNILTRLYGLQDTPSLKKQITSIAAPWRPNRSLAVKYLFAWHQTQK